MKKKIGPWSLMCCGCRRFLTDEGELFDPKDQGIFDWSAVASFDQPDDADQAALAAGWAIKDQDGPNHRCPECQAKPAGKVSRGAYVEVPRQWRT